MTDFKPYYLEKGQGQPLLLLHGNAESSAFFHSQIEYFSCDYRVIAPDTRGHGRSARGSKPLDLLQCAEDLRLFLDDLGIAKAHLLGFSDGGNIALLFALKYPQYIDRLVLNGANLYPNGLKWHVLMLIYLEFGLFSLLSAVNKRFLLRKEIVQLMVNQPNIPGEALSALLMPTLVIAGDRDMISDAHTRAIASNIKNSRLLILPGDHFLAKKSPELFNGHVAAFLRGDAH